MIPLPLSRLSLKELQADPRHAPYCDLLQYGLSCPWCTSAIVRDEQDHIFDPDTLRCVKCRQVVGKTIRPCKEQIKKPRHKSYTLKK